ncbi:MAG: hypothetical protein BWY85_00804 [Firmicutes bacterium ADurb.Bin506]|jgi:hypothetical protein|nr:MAG: hypothetical protein BWY85_00804 [Firmicutes bacterium ADurb.Bin506]
MRGTAASWVVTGLGAVVSGVGSRMKGRVGDGLMGFGLAHVVLGVLDMFRPSLRD